jgi:alkyl hydroperoxide reductase subunit AhpF
MFLSAPYRGRYVNVFEEKVTLASRWQQPKQKRMITLNHQLTRLKEIHYRCYNNGNINDFLDLVHTLRMFSEYKEKINDVIIEGAEFQSERP